MDFELSDRCKQLRERLLAFMDEHVYPAEPVYHQQLVDSGEPHFHPPVMEELKARAREQGLWNLCLPHDDRGRSARADERRVRAAGGDHGPQPHRGRRRATAPRPTPGNMEVLTLFGTPEQKDRWLRPLLDGEIRSAFAMTEPGVASSDATNIETADRARRRRVRPQRPQVVDVGRHARALPDHDRDGQDRPGRRPPYRQQSMILVPLDTPGVDDRAQPAGVRLRRPGGPRRDRASTTSACRRRT